MQEFLKDSEDNFIQCLVIEMCVMLLVAIVMNIFVIAGLATAGAAIKASILSILLIMVLDELGAVVFFAAVMINHK